MRPLLRTALASLACAVLAACSDEPTSASRAPTLPRPNLAVDPDPGPLQAIKPCDINALKADARLYANKSNDVLLTIIGDLAPLVKNGPTSTGNDKAFDGLNRVAAIRGTSAQKAGVTGTVFDRLVKRFVGCMQETVYAGVKEPDLNKDGIGDGFKQALGDGWVFEVRGKATDGAPVPGGAAFERATTTPETWWAVDVPTGDTWADAIITTITNDRVLIFGWRTSTFIPSNARAGSSFDHRTLPDVNGTSFVLDANVGLCFADDGDVNPGTQRVNHASEFLPLADPIRCGTTVPPLITPANVPLAMRPLSPVRLAQRAVNFFMPQTAHAAMFFGGSITGRPDDFSPSAVIDLSKVNLVFDPIADGVNTTPLASNTTPSHEVRVYAVTNDGVAIPGVDVVVRIAGNSSTISAFGGQSNPDATIFPDRVEAKGTPDGYAKLTGVILTKAGGYTLSAQVDVQGVFSSPILFNSLSFNIQNK